MNLEANLKFQEKYFKDIFKNYNINSPSETKVELQNNIEQIILGDRITILTNDLPNIIEELFPNILISNIENYTSINISKDVNFVVEYENNEIFCYTPHPFPVGKLFIRITKSLSDDDLKFSELILCFKKLSVLENRKLKNILFKVKNIDNPTEIHDILSYLEIKYKPLSLNFKSEIPNISLNLNSPINISLKIIDTILKEFQQNPSINLRSTLKFNINKEFELQGVKWITQYMNNDFYNNLYIVEQFFQARQKFKVYIEQNMDIYVDIISDIFTDTSSVMYSKLLNTSIIDIDKIVLDCFNQINTIYHT
ncbi:MAG: hypothetical protein ATN36_07080 [Epulopiscium sp. Nele67-Bin005]|nr:MAG: hypothetical protein ATN36_07080 [Epulopiscium sp. Nele67-Bin005]